MTIRAGGSLRERKMAIYVISGIASTRIYFVVYSHCADIQGRGVYGY